MRVLYIFSLLLAYSFAEDALQELQKGNLEFSASLYQQIAKENNGNIIASPLSAQLVLALTQLGAKGATAQEMTKGLRLPDTPEKVKEAFKTLIPQLKGNDLYSLSSANKVYLKQGYPINPEFKKLSEEIFDASLENIDFDQAALAAQTINKWVEGKTNGKITDLVQAKMFDQLTRLVLVNAIYFKANWSSPFDSYATYKRKFFKTEKDSIEVETMHQTSSLKYAENKNLDAQFVQIPYAGNNVVFTVIVPNKKEGLAAIENRLSEALKPQEYTPQTISLFMPKFKVESTLKLVPALKALGIEKPFSDTESDLSGFILNNEPLKISDVVQKAFINVTEEGTEAAAATAVLIITDSAVIYDTEPKIVVADRPFFFTISTKDNTPIFIGRVNDPAAD